MTNNTLHSTQAHLLSIGYELIATKGFAAVGLSEILSCANVSKGSFYHYFKSKEAFGQALIEHYFGVYYSHIDALFERTDLTAAARFMLHWQELAQHQCASGSGNQCLTVKLTAEVADLSDGMRQALQAGTDQILNRYTCIINAGLEDGSMRPQLASEALSLILYELWLGASLLTKIRRNHTALDAAKKTTEQLLNINHKEI